MFDQFVPKPLMIAFAVSGAVSGIAGRVRRRPRLGGLLNFYERAA